jgi:hypothetical protein
MLGALKQLEKVGGHMRLGSRFLLVAVLFWTASPSQAGSIPAGSRAIVRINNSLSSGHSYKEESWSGTLTSDIRRDGRIFARAGDPVRGTVTYVKRSGRLHDPGQISLRLTSIDGRRVYSTRVSRKGKSHTRGNIEKIGGGAAGGALIGGLIGGGKGAAIGAGAGAAAGTGVAAETGKDEAVIPAESVFTFRITGSR